MKATKLIKKSALCLLLAETLFFTELPVLAEDPVETDNAWESSEETSADGNPKMKNFSPRMTFLMLEEQTALILKAWKRILIRQKKLSSRIRMV